MSWKVVGIVWSMVVVAAIGAFFGIQQIRNENAQAVIVNQQTDSAVESASSPAVSSANNGQVAGTETSVPEPSNAFLQEQEVLNGGMYRSYTTNQDPVTALTQYETALENAGWTIDDTVIDENPWDLTTSLAAFSSPLYLVYIADSTTGSTILDLCIWAVRPVNIECGGTVISSTTTGEGETTENGFLIESENTETSPATDQVQVTP